VVKHVHAAELRVVVVAVLAVAVDAVFAAQLLSKLGAHLATALARLHVRNLAQRAAWRRGGMREKREGRGAEKRKKIRGAVRLGKQEMPVTRARVSRTGE
jgi:hypothetical protein